MNNNIMAIKNNINQISKDINNLEKEILIKDKQNILKDDIQILFDKLVNEDNKLSNLEEQLQKLKSPYIPKNGLKYQAPPSKRVDIVYREIQEFDQQIKLLKDKIQNLYLLPLFINFKST